jgi:hypothetical protein
VLDDVHRLQLFAPGLNERIGPALIVDSRNSGMFGKEERENVDVVLDRFRVFELCDAPHGAAWHRASPESNYENDEVRLADTVDRHEARLFGVRRPHLHWVHIKAGLAEIVDDSISVSP